SGAQNGTATIVTVGSTSESGTVTLTTVPAAVSGGTVKDVSAFVTLTATSGTITASGNVAQTATSGTFSPASSPAPGGAFVQKNAPGSAPTPAPDLISSGTVTLQPGTYYGGICIGAASGAKCGT